MRVMVVSLVMAAVAVGAAAVNLDGLQSDLEAARRSWDSEAATGVLSRIRMEVGQASGEASLWLRVRAGLTVAELLRVDLEAVPADDREQRRVVGSRIDAAAEEALTLVDELPESSERERVRADLLATMIRSDFRAKKYEDRLRAAVARALELDESNPAAHVAAAKPLLFAPEGHGRDPSAALAHLDRALELDPASEPARLLRIIAREDVGDRAGAEADAREALRRNPSCVPAERALQRLGG
jgi:tetratricopeptide (TPR) repeat protein